jgi:spermidine/putrescine transport system permease protein
MSTTTVPGAPAAAAPAETRRAVVRKRSIPPWLGRVGSMALNVYAALGFVYLFAPIAVIVLFSFNQPKGKFNLVWQRFTFDNWAHPFARHELTDALTKSLQIATLATIAATVLGALIALALARYRFRGGAIINLLLVLPLTTPEIVLGASLLNLFVKTDTQRNFWTIFIAHTMFCVSFVAITVKARVRGFDWTLEDAAMDLGARPWRTFRKVTLPLILPGILAAALLSFSLSIDDYIVTTFTAGQTVTFPLQIAGAFQREISPQINVLASMILIVSVAIMGIGSLLGARRASRIGA